MLNKIKQNKDNQSGFTIIEVLIVLAIAGLILLIVFLAVPALQRNTRNAGRKEDAGRLVTAVNNYVSNNSGALPDPTNNGANTIAATMNPAWALLAAALKKDAGTLNQFNTVSNYNAYLLSTRAPAPTWPVTIPANNFYWANITPSATPSASTIITAPTGNAIVLWQGATCTGSTNTGSTFAPAPATTPNAAALIYTIETGSGAYNWACSIAS